MTDMTTSPRSGRRSVLRLAVAGLVTLLAGLVAAVFWVVGQAQYTNDYCATRAPQPEPSPPFFEKGMSGEPAYMDGPYTVICEYDEHPTVEVFDPTVLIVALFLAAIVIFIGICAFYWAWDPKQPKETRTSGLTRLVRQALDNRPPDGPRVLENLSAGSRPRSTDGLSVPQWVRPRHARLVVGAAQVWCQLMLETLADTRAPWRESSTDS